MAINKLLLKRIKITLFAILAFILFLVFYNHKKVINTISELTDKKSIVYNIKLEKVSIFGTKHFDQKEIIALFVKDYNKPLYSIDTDKKLEQISKITWVKNAAISKKYPNAINIKISERIPLAYWQNNGKINLIDMDGHIIKTNKIFFGKPLVIGNGAHKDAANLVRILRKYKGFKIKYATYIGERRWDATMDNDIIVKLPDENLEEAVRKYLELCAKTPIDPEIVTAVDMRYIKDNKIHVQNKKVLRKRNEI